MATSAAQIPTRQSIIEGGWAASLLNMRPSAVNLSRSGMQKLPEGVDKDRRIVYMSAVGVGAGMETEEGEGGTITIKGGERSSNGCD